MRAEASRFGDSEDRQEQGKTASQIGNARWDAVKMPPPHGFSRSVSRNPSADVSTVFPVSTANSAWDLTAAWSAFALVSRKWKSFKRECTNMPEVSLCIISSVTAMVFLTPEAAGNVETSIATRTHHNHTEGTKHKPEAWAAVPTRAVGMWD